MEVKTQIIIDWGDNPSKLEVLKSILSQAKAPDWHGLGLDALEDSFVVGNINEAKPPYEFCFKNLKTDKEEIMAFQNSLIEIFTECVRRYEGSTMSIE